MDVKTLNTLHPLDPEKVSEDSGCSIKPNNCEATDCRVTQTKRSACVICPTSPRKRQRVAEGPTDTKRAKGKYCTELKVPKLTIQVPVEGQMAHGTKRKAGAESVTPSKKRRAGTSNSNTTIGVGVTGATKVSVERIRQSEVTETPRRTIHCDLSQSSSSPSASQQRSGSMSTSVTTCKPTFEDAYLQLEELGEGGFGSVYAGKRKSDDLPVAIKRIPKVDEEGRPTVSQSSTMGPLEALLMLTAGGGRASVGKFAAVSLID